MNSIITKQYNDKYKKIYDNYLLHNNVVIIFGTTNLNKDYFGAFDIINVDENKQILYIKMNINKQMKLIKDNLIQNIKNEFEKEIKEKNDYFKEKKYYHLRYNFLHSLLEELVMYVYHPSRFEYWNYELDLN